MSKRQIPAHKLVGKVCRWQTPHHKRGWVGTRSFLLKELRENAEAILHFKETSVMFLVVDVCDYSARAISASLFCKVLFQDGSCWWTPYKLNWPDAVPNIVIAGP